MKLRKVATTAVHTTTGETQRLFAEETEDGKVFVWTKTMRLGTYETARFGDRLSRDWVRNLLAATPFRAEF